MCTSQGYGIKMYSLILSTFLVRRVTTSCVQSLIPAGHVQLNIEPEKESNLKAALGDFEAHAFTLYDTCVPGFATPPSAYVIMMHGDSDLDAAIEQLFCDHKRWWPLVWTVIILRNMTLETYDAENFALRAIGALWAKMVFNCAVLIEADMRVYKADPFSPKNHCGREAAEVYRSTCSHTPQVYRPTFPGCRILVSGRDAFPFSVLTTRGYEGADAKLANLIAYKSNLSIEWSFRPNQYTAPTHIAHAYYENVSRGELDLAIGGSVLSYTYFNNVTFAYSHVTQYLYFYVPNGGELVGWQKLVAMFPIFMWLYILLALVFSVLTLSFFGEEDTSTYFLIVLGILLEEPVKLLPGKLRLVLLCILVPFLYISSMYTTTLHSYTMSPPSARNIKTLDDLIESNFSIMLSDTNKFITDKVTSQKLKFVLSRSFPSPGLEEGAKQLEDYRNFAVVERDIEMRGLMAKTGYSFHNVDFKITTIRNSVVYPKGSQYVKRFHRLIVGAIESGHIDRWMKNLLANRKAAKPLSIGEGGPLRPIRWPDVDSAFTILLVGHALAAVAFLAEIVIYKLKLENMINISPFAVVRSRLSRQFDPSDHKKM